jgi:hypothetical protein
LLLALQWVEAEESAPHYIEEKNVPLSAWRTRVFAPHQARLEHAGVVLLQVRGVGGRRGGVVLGLLLLLSGIARAVVRRMQSDWLRSQMRCMCGRELACLEFRMAGGAGFHGTNRCAVDALLRSGVGCPLGMFRGSGASSAKSSAIVFTSLATVRAAIGLGGFQAGCFASHRWLRLRDRRQTQRG